MSINQILVPMKYLSYLFLVFSVFYSCSSDDGGTAPTPPPTPTAPNPNIVPEGSDDFNKIAVPVNAPEGMKWEYQDDFSDDFNYEFGPVTELQNFGTGGKWVNRFHNGWQGPGLTLWKRENVLVDGDELKLITTRDGTTRPFDGEDRKITQLGAVSSSKQVLYPVYIEVKAKIPNSVNACAAWLLSPDDTQEIDFLEAWGGEYERNNLGANAPLAERLHFSHHLFIREPFEDYQPKDQSTWYTDNGTIWNDAFHRFGVFWESPTRLRFYLDGRLVKTTEGLDNTATRDGIDPVGFTATPLKSKENRTGLNKPMDIIIDMEDQDWRARLGSTPTDEEILNTADHTLRVDWIRVYKPVAK